MTSSKEFKAYVVREINGEYKGAVESREIKDLPSSDLLVKVAYSSLNYKDALSVKGNKGVTRNYPHTPGIDAVGTVVESKSGSFQEGDQVIVTSYDLGMNTPGGFGQYIRVPSEWAVALPETLTMKQSMIYGTAGFTAGQIVSRLVELVKPDDGNILISGATGGVGTISIGILNKLGYKISAITGKESQHSFLEDLGVSEIISRKEFEEMEDRPMLMARYAGAVDAVGGRILENMIKSVKTMGAVVCCGNAASPNLELTVYPFILRGITLIGISSQNCPMDIRKEVWKNLADDWKSSKLLDVYNEISLDGLHEKTELILMGKLTGRTIVNLEE